MGTRESPADQLMSEAEFAKLLKVFDDTKAGVKGLVDSRITKVPPIFIDTKKKLHDDLEQQHSINKDSTFTLPIIDLNGIAENPILRAEVVERIRDATEKCGFFLIKNHGIPESIVDEMIEGVGRFHEQDVEIKKPFYSRDRTRRFIYNSNFALVNGLAANWRDTIECILAPHHLDAQDVPLICRESFMNYSKHIKNLGISLLELLSESLGLKPDYLKEEMHCTEGSYLLANYYPPCPEPNVTWGISEHTDGGFLTILLQDGIGGLQVLHDDQWIDVPYIPGTLIINISDLLQDVEIKKPFYSRDRTKRFIYNSNFALINGLAANWRDTVEYTMAPYPIDAQDLPPICRESFMNYTNHIKNLGTTLLQLLSEVLGLKPDYLKEEMHCAEAAVLLANYYPPCPQPNLTWGISEHTDGGFLTILLQDDIGGLQVLHMV